MLSSVHCLLTPYFQCVLLKRVRWLTVLVAILSKATIRLVTIPTKDGIHNGNYFHSEGRSQWTGTGCHYTLWETLSCSRSMGTRETSSCLHLLQMSSRKYTAGDVVSPKHRRSQQSVSAWAPEETQEEKVSPQKAHSLWQYMMSPDIQTRERQSMFCSLSGDCKLFHCPLLRQKKIGWLSSSSLISRIAMTTNYLRRQVKAL